MNLFFHKLVRHVLYDSSIQMASRLEDFLLPIIAQGKSVLAIGERSSKKTLVCSSRAESSIGHVALREAGSWSSFRGCGHHCMQRLALFNLTPLHLEKKKTQTYWDSDSLVKKTLGQLRNATPFLFLILLQVVNDFAFLVLITCPTFGILKNA